MATPAPNPLDVYVTEETFRAGGSDELVQKIDVRAVASASLYDRYNAAAVVNWREDVLLALQRAVGEELNPSQVARSLHEFTSDGDDDGVTDNATAITNLLAAVAAAGGGIAIIPPAATSWLFTGSIVVPDDVEIVGFGWRSILAPRPGSGVALDFNGATRSGIRNVQILGDAASVQGTAVRFAGAQRCRGDHVVIWDFELGLDAGDGVINFAAYNTWRNFEFNRCERGVQAYGFCNGLKLDGGRIFWCFDGSGSGVGIDVDGARTLTIDNVDIESADILFRARGLVEINARGGFWETGAALRDGWDVDIDAGSKLNAVGMVESVLGSQSLQVGLEEICDWQASDHYPFGASRHHAAAAAQNLIENGDFQRANGIVGIDNWSFTGTPTVAENTTDHVTAGRTYDITQVVSANDGMNVVGIVPEGTDYITAVVRFKKLTAGNPFFALVSGGNTAQWDGTHLPVSSSAWRIGTLRVPVDPAANGVFGVTVTADQSAAGGQIRLDEVAATAGRVATVPRRHGHRIQLLPQPLELLDRNRIAGNETFGPINLATAGGAGANGLSQMPQGAIGALVRLEGQTTGGTIGVIRAQEVNPYLDITGGTAVRCQIVADQVITSKDVIVRDLTLTGGLNFPGGVGAATDYNLYLLGWVLPD